MDWKDLVELIVGLQGHSLADLITALVGHAASKLAPGKWTVQIDDVKLPHGSVTAHDFGLNGEEGVYATWSWTQDGTTHKLDATEFQKLDLAIDDDDKDDPRFILTTGSEGDFPHAYIIIHFKFTEAGKTRDYRFAGKMS